ncbi:hypothetical protein [Enterobacter cloacae]|uniref:hypothetical protein n=1 Tax=Enterobacter cloacae TaxID=550 RepID=UPI00388DAF08
MLESTATVIDELVDLHDRILVKLFSGAKHKHQQQFQKQGKAINDKVRLYSGIGQALLEAKESGSDPYAAIEAVIPPGRVHRERQRGRAAGPAGRLRPPAPGRRELRHPAPLHAGLAGGAGTARRAGRARRAGSRADPA